MLRRHLNLIFCKSRDSLYAPQDNEAAVFDHNGDGDGGSVRLGTAFLTGKGRDNSNSSTIESQRQLAGFLQADKARLDSGESIPGCVHTDLLAAGKIPDPFYRDNEKIVQWVGDSDWIYRRTFDVPEDVLKNDRVLLRCAGLDTLATIKINGTEVGHADNMFRLWEFDVKPLLRLGENEN